MIIRNTRRKLRVCRLQNQNGIVTPPLPLNAVVAQRGASVGIPHKYYWQRKSGGSDKKSSLLGRQASQAAFRLPLKTGEPVPLSSRRLNFGHMSARIFTSDGQCPPRFRETKAVTDSRIKANFHENRSHIFIVKAVKGLFYGKKCSLLSDCNRCQYCTQT